LREKTTHEKKFDPMNKTITLTIDNKEIQAPEGANLLQVAKDNGFAIPHLCYHKKLTPTGACRLCVVKSKAPATW
jgi:NADH dehydrogenase/NADH:ubiquinone oxidoreductase subunit G